jgi:hypothetical protein
MSPSLPLHHRPTERQISYLKRLTGISQQLRLQRFVARRLGKVPPEAGGAPLTRADFSAVIDAELGGRRLAA